MQKTALALIVSRAHNHIVLVQRKDVPVWVLPGGGVDEPENCCEAAIREAYEETGLHISVAQHVATYIPVNKLSFYTELFLCEDTSENLTDGNDEVVAAKRFPLENLPPLLFPIHKRYIEEWRHTTQYPITRYSYEISYCSLCLLILRHPVLSLRYLYACWKRRKQR